MGQFERPRRLLAGALLACAALALVLSMSREADAQTNGVSFGAYAHPIDGQTNQTAIEELERELGTTLPLVRGFNGWDDTFAQDKPLHRWVRDGGRDLSVSIKPVRVDGSRIPWKSIADARPGSTLWGDMEEMADAAKRYGDPIILIFHHEPERNNNTAFGTSDDFVAAFRNFRSAFDAEGVSNVHFAWVMTDWSFAVGSINPNDRRVAQKWYPGDDVVDMIGVDPYNWNNCRGNTTDPWRSLEELIAPFMTFAANHPDKPLIIGEIGSDEGANGQKAEWIADARQLLKSEPYRTRFASVMYYHDDGRGEGWHDCNWWLNSSASSLNAARAWAKDSAFRVQVGFPAHTPGQVTPTTAKPAPASTTTTTTSAAPKPTIANTAPECDGRPATIVGTSGDDMLVGTPDVDVIHGREGNDTIKGLGGNDILCGGDGNDEILGGGGRDRIFGNAGSDLLLGGLGPDALFGGTGQDRLNGQHGNDIVMGGIGRDVLRGGPHQDTMFGGDHADRLLGQGGFDSLYGGDGHDLLEGGVGADTLKGGSGDDRCISGPGRDRVTCERGS